jgi:DNA-binding MarR family transcriptional regulator
VDVHDEIQEIARDCLAVRVRALNRVISTLYDDALRPLGVRVSQMNILVVTARLGTVRPAKVCEILHMDASTLSRNVERLRAKRWVETVAEDDGRAQPFRLTAQGQRVLGRLVPAWREAQQRAEELLGAEGVAQLKQMAARMGTKGS